MTSTEVQGLLASLPETSRSAIAADPRVLEQLVRTELLRRAVVDEVRASGFERDAAVVAQLDKLRDEALMRQWIANKAKPASTFPTEDVVRAAYESNKAAFAAPVEYRIAQIFVSAPNGGEATQLSAALKKAAEIGGKIGNSDFAALAQAQSEHADSAAKGGDLGFLPENRLLPEVATAIRTLAAGQTVGPLKTAQGLHFLKLLEKKEGAVPEYAAIRDSIATALREKQAQQLEQAYLSELGAKLGISVNQIELSKLQSTLQ